MNKAGVKRFLHRWAWWSVAMVLLSWPSVRAQPSEGPATGVKHAFLDSETGKRVMLLTSGSVTNISNEGLRFADGVRLQFFDDTGKTNLEVGTPLCLYNTRTKLVSSAEKLQGKSPDGQFSLEGEGFAYGTGVGGLVISNHVHAVIRRALLANPSPVTATPGADRSRTNAVPALDPNIDILSERLRYQTNLTVFREHVRVEDSQGTLTCELLTVEFIEPGQGEERRRIDRILAEQDVVIDSAELHATGEQATYRQAADLVELTGNPTWRLRQYQGRADELVVNRGTREFHAAHNVEMTLPPGSVGRSGFVLPQDPAPTNMVAQGAQPVQVRADDFQFQPEPGNTNFNLAVLRGDVRVRSGTGKLGCDQMTIRSLAPSNRTESILAERNVVMEQGDRRVTGTDVVYTALSDTVEVTGQPAWKMGTSEGTAELLAFDLTNGVYRATGGVQMHVPAGSFGRSAWLFPPAAAGVGQATHLPLGHLAGETIAGETPATAAGTAAPLGTVQGSESLRLIEISSDEFEFHSAAPQAKTDTAVYRGSVRVKDPDRMQLSCEQLTAKFLSGTNQVESMVAERNVDIDIRQSRAERHARGDKAVYTAGEAAVELTGDEGVEIEFVDANLAGCGTGAKAAYAGGPDVLELSGNPVLTTQYGELSGDIVVLDRANTTLKATGNWKLNLTAETVRKAAQPTTSPRTGGVPPDS